MTLLSVVRDVCAVVGVQLPTSVTSNIVANRTMQEMLALANEMAQRIAYDTRDWTMLRAGGVFIGDGIKTSFPMPSDYKRLLLTSNVWRSTSTQYPMVFVADHEAWLQSELSGTYDGRGQWTLANGAMIIKPPLAIGQTAVFHYLQKNCVVLTAGGYGDRFVNDADSFILDERLLKLGMIWQWKQNKGTSYAEDMGTYETALSVAAGHDRPAPIIVGRHPISANARVAYPWPTP